MPEESRAGFSALVRAMRELNSVAAARLVKKNNSDPQFVVLIPVCFTLIVMGHEENVDF